MRRWRRFLLAILAVPLLVLLNATPERGADRRLTAAVFILQVLIFVAAIAGFFWLVAPILTLQERIGPWLAIAVIGTFGTFLAVVGLAGCVQTAVLLRQGRRATATIVGDTNPCDKPQFQFS